MYISKWLVAVLVSLLLVACNGGDGDSTTFTNLIPTTDNTQNTGNQVTITSQNSTKVSGTILKRIFDTSDSSSMLFDISTGMGTNFVSGVDIDDGFNLVNYAKRQMERVKYSGISATSSFVTGAVLTENNLPCDEGGTQDVTWADNDDNEDVSVNDTFTVTSHNCVEDGETTNGKMSFTLLEEEPNLSMDFVFADLTTTDLKGTLTLDGDMSISIKGSELDESIESFSVTSNTFKFSIKESGAVSNDLIYSNYSVNATMIGTLNSIVMTADILTFTDGEAKVTRTVNDFSLTTTEDSNTLHSTLDFKGTFNDPELGGTFSVKTLQPFEKPATDDFPYAGIMKITASNNSSVTVTALDSVNVRLDVDEDGDGAIDRTSDTTWTSLDIS